MGIWNARVDSQRELISPFGRVFHPTSPLPVAQWEDKINDEEVIDFQLDDPIAVAEYGSDRAVRTVHPGDH
ncbi:MAG: hypothetical protein GX575_14255 [Candidatus Anammoximicrobium sp.]|nr:hypothetical protein [Candidatus Anammoximicrobium sp.]